MATDEEYMRQALALAAKGAGWVNPNPQVGCVIVKDDRIIGKGWHTAYGKLHAEREALAHCAQDPKGATAYVTLEPCCHYGKTPPCTEGLIEAGIARVVMGAPDPNPLVAGKGVAKLRQAGIQVDEGVLVEECQEINKEWLYYIQHKRPYVMAKCAMTADGKVGIKPGQSCWLTGKEAGQRTHLDRKRFAAIMVGIGTVLADDPQLTCRLEGEVKQPLRVVVDSKLRIPVGSQLVRSANETPLFVATTAQAPQEKVAQLRQLGVEVALLSDCDGRVDLAELMDVLGAHGIDSLIAEGGATLLAALFRQKLVQGVQIYVAPCLFGAGTAEVIASLGLQDAASAPKLRFTQVSLLGKDVLMEGEVC